MFWIIVSILFVLSLFIVPAASIPMPSSDHISLSSSMPSLNPKNGIKTEQMVEEEDDRRERC